MGKRKKILLFTDWYYPGFKAGGPIQSCRNLAGTMRSEADFYIITSDRDLGETHAYPGIKPHSWHRGPSGEKIFYADNARLSIPAIREFIGRVKPDAVYFNSMFSVKYTVFPLMALKTMRGKVKKILAPRGMLHTGAMGMKSKKKNAFLRAFKLMQLHRKLHFHATDAEERKDIGKHFPAAPIHFAENIPALLPFRQRMVKEPGRMKLIFISRIHPKKNLRFILEQLKETDLNGNISFDIYGDGEGNAYASECKQLAADLPGNIRVQFKGALPNTGVAEVLKEAHFFILPTLGENFGHAIFEALSVGLPVLLSDQTPWRNLADKKAGWDIPLHHASAYKETLQTMLRMEQNEYTECARQARSLAEEYFHGAGFIEKYKELFA